MTSPGVVMAVWVVIGVVCLMLSGAYSGFETGWYQLSEVRLRLRAAKEGRWWARLLETTRHRDRFICVLLIGNNVANYGTTAATAVLLSFAGLSDHQMELYSTLVVMPLLFVVGEMVPKSLFQARADTLTVRWMWLLWLSRYIFGWLGLVRLIQGATSAVMWLFGHRGGHASELFAPREHIRSILREQTAHGLLSKTQLDVAHHVLNVGHVRLREAMTPLDQVVRVEESATRNRVREEATGNDFSRLAVHATGDRDQLVGFVDVNQVLLGGEPDASIRLMIRSAVRLEASLSVTAALVAMQECGCPFGLVIDRRSRPIGIVTVKDLVGEFVGEFAA